MTRWVGGRICQKIKEVKGRCIFRHIERERVLRYHVCGRRVAGRNY